jgi:hypothetical protein
MSSEFNLNYEPVRKISRYKSKVGPGCPFFVLERARKYNALVVRIQTT